MSPEFMGMSGSVVHFFFVPIPLSKPEEVTFMEKQEIECQNDVWLFTLAQFQIVVWIPYVFWCQTLKRILCPLVAGHWIKKPIILDLRQKWTNYLQSDLDEIWSQLQPKNWWMNKCRHTHKCTGNVPGHITGAGVFSSAPSHTWISSSQNRGKRGRRAERVTRT